MNAGGQSTEPDLPRGVALAWGVAANPQRGPKRELSIERIVDAAVEIADAGGLGAVSMASVSASLGFTTMSLYRYLDSKDELYAVMVDVAYGPPALEYHPQQAWRERITRAGLAIEAEIAWPRGGSSLYLRDPAGNSVELAPASIWSIPD